MPSASQLATNDKLAAIVIPTSEGCEADYLEKKKYRELSSEKSEPRSCRRRRCRGGGRIMPHVLWPEPLSAAQLKRLDEHKYSASGRSLLEPPLQIYWNWLVQQIPLWVAPNTLTIVGLVINVLTTAVLVFYCPTATEEVSSGVVWYKVCLLFYLFFYVGETRMLSPDEIKVQIRRPLCNLQRL